MHIGFDAKRLFNNHTGLGNYSRTLVQNLNRFYPEFQVRLFAPNMEHSDYRDDFKTIKTIDPKPRIAAYWRSYGITKDINRDAPDIYHGLSNELPFNSKKIRAKTIVSIHDLFYEKFPEDFSTIDRKIYRYKTQKACDQADHIIAISEATKADILQYTNTAPEKISVLYQSCANHYWTEYTEDKLENQLDLPKEYCLYVGSINRRKNLLSLVQAMAELSTDIRIPIVVVGRKKGAYYQEVAQYVREQQLEKWVYFVGYQANSQLKALYQAAVFFCLPSFYEGFGIPILESLCCGTPVLSSDVSALPEVVGPCGSLIDPNDIGSIRTQMEQLICNESLRKQYRSQIQEHIVQFSPENTTKSLVDLYKNII